MDVWILAVVFPPVLVSPLVVEFCRYHPLLPVLPVLLVFMTDLLFESDGVDGVIPLFHERLTSSLLGVDFLVYL